MKRSKSLVKGCEILHKLTHCHVKLSIKPSWSSNGGERSYTSPGYPMVYWTKESTPSSSTPVTSSTLPVSAPTPIMPERSPSKSPQDKIDTAQNQNMVAESTTTAKPFQKSVNKTTAMYDKKICSLCGIEYRSVADLEKKIESSWINCSGKNGRRACSYWVHSACVGIYYPTSDQGKAALAKWSVSHFFCPSHIPKE